MLNEAVLLEQNKRLREENEELKEALRQTREIETRDVAFPDWVPRLTPLEGAVLALLCHRDIVTASTVTAVIHDGDAKSQNLLGVIVHRLRRKLSPHGIEIRNLWGRGYRLTDASRAALLPAEKIAA